MGTVVIIAEEAGCSNSFSSLIHYLSDNQINLTLIGYKYAKPVWTRRGISNFSIVDSFNDAIYHLEKIEKVDCLLTGTSEFPDETNKYWEWASQNQIPSIAYVDNWYSYWQRFTSKNQPDASKFGLLPNTIAVTDQIMKQRMIENSCPLLSKDIVITGNPSFDHLYKLKQEISPKKLDGPIKILFVTMPVDLDYENQARERLGYNETEVTDYLLSALESLAETNNTNYILYIKPHPIENEEKYQDIINQSHIKNLSVEIVKGDPLHWVLNSDFVIGMYTVLLYEAALLGKKVISLQPNRKLGNDITDFNPSIKVVTTYKGATQSINDTINSVRSSTENTHLNYRENYASKNFYDLIQMIITGTAKNVEDIVN